MTHLPDLCRRSLLLALAVAAWPGAILAEGPPLLTIVDAAGGVHVLDEAAFAAMPQHELTTNTVWTDELQTFRGVLLTDVLALAGTRQELEGRTLMLRALNDYSIEIPAGDAWTYGTVLARQQNGVTLHRRDKGPIWLVYPRDKYDVLRDQRYDSRWVWQLSEIVVK